MFYTQVCCFSLQIFTPDGVTISFDARIYPRFRWANVYITTTSRYSNQTYGMCGNNNDIVGDDLMGRQGNKFNSENGIVAPLSYTDEWK